MKLSDVLESKIIRGDSFFMSIVKEEDKEGKCTYTLLEILNNIPKPSKLPSREKDPLAFLQSLISEDPKEMRVRDANVASEVILSYGEVEIDAILKSPILKEDIQKCLTTLRNEFVLRAQELYHEADLSSDPTTIANRAEDIAEGGAKGFKPKESYLDALSTARWLSELEDDIGQEYSQVAKLLSEVASEIGVRLQNSKARS